MTAAWDWGAAEVAAYVADALGERAADEAARLSGGLLNVVWRVPLRSRSVIAKVAPPFVAALPDVPLDVARQRVEAGALAAFAPGGPLADVVSDAVRPPRPLHHDPVRSVLLMEDVGAWPDLGVALRKGGGDPAVLGDRLGRFVGRLHATAVTPALRAAFENPSAQATRLAVQYRAVGPALAAAGVSDADALGRDAVALGERLLRPGRCLIHGDLWPPSVLVGPGARLRLIDWELAHVGVPAQDLGHLAAHLWMARHHEAGTAARAEGAWAAFASGYLSAGPSLAPDDLADAARHFGCELVARTVGPFRVGTVYGDLGPEDPALRAALSTAAGALRQAECGELNGLFG